MLPKNGAVCQQFVRCGKTNCRCTRGELHGPYFYLFWRENGQLKKEYIRRENVEQVRDSCEVKRESRRLAKESSHHWRELQAAIREVEKWMRS